MSHILHSSAQTVVTPLLHWAFSVNWTYFKRFFSNLTTHTTFFAKNLIPSDAPWHVHSTSINNSFSPKCHLLSFCTERLNYFVGNVLADAWQMSQHWSAARSMRALDECNKYSIGEYNTYCLEFKSWYEINSNDLLRTIDYRIWLHDYLDSELFYPIFHCFNTNRSTHKLDIKDHPSAGTFVSSVKFRNCDERTATPIGLNNHHWNGYSFIYGHREGCLLWTAKLCIPGK
jgi:hypothetical protein